MTEKSRPDSKRWGGRNTIRSLCYRTGTSPQRERSSGWRLPCSIGASRDEKLPNGSKTGGACGSRGPSLRPPSLVRSPSSALGSCWRKRHRHRGGEDANCKGGALREEAVRGRERLRPAGSACGQQGSQGETLTEVLRTQGGPAAAGHGWPCGPQGGPAAGHGGRGGRRPAGEAFGRQGVKGGWLRGIHWF